MQGDNLPKGTFVCTDHFSPKDYDYVGSRLNKTSVPNKDLKFSESASYNLSTVFNENFTVKSPKTSNKKSDDDEDDAQFSEFEDSVLVE